jgi:hypothetical protein
MKEPHVMGTRVGTRERGTRGRFFSCFAGVKVLLAGPGDYPKWRGALAAFHIECRLTDLLKYRVSIDRQTVFALEE